MYFRMQWCIATLLILFSSSGRSQTIKFPDPAGSFSLHYSSAWQETENVPGFLLMITPKVPFHLEKFPTTIQVKKAPKEPGMTAGNITELARFLDKKFQDNAASLRIKEGSSQSSVQQINGIDWYTFDCLLDKGKAFPDIRLKLWETSFNDSLYSVVLTAPVTNFRYCAPAAELMIGTFLFKNSNADLISRAEKNLPVLAAAVPPEPKVIDYGEVDDFHESFAVARKGDEYTIIDTLGNERLQPGKYVLINRQKNTNQSVYSGFFNGMCVVQDKTSMLYGYIDTSFKLVIPCVYNTATVFQKDGYALVTQVDEKKGDAFRYFIDKKGKRFINKITNPDEFLVWQYVIDQKNIATKDYYRKNGTFAFKTKDGNSKFADAMSRVSASFNTEVRYGFIDTTGRQVIPNKFTGEFMDFSEGLVRYKPVYTDVYKYSFIDKKGEEVFRMNPSDSVRNIIDPGPFKYGYSLFSSFGESDMEGHSKALVNRNGKITILEHLFRKALAGYERDNPRRYSELYFNYIDRTKRLVYFTFPYQAQLKNGTSTEKDLYGLLAPKDEAFKYADRPLFGAMSYEGKIIIPPVFSSLGPEDPVSGVLKAAFVASIDKDFTDQVFLNSRGQVILVIKTPYRAFRSSGVQYNNSNYSYD